MTMQFSKCTVQSFYCHAKKVPILRETLVCSIGCTQHSAALYCRAFFASALCVGAPF
jgi:hypothetical protein